LAYGLGRDIMIKSVITYGLVLLGLVVADATGLDQFFFPEYLQKKITNQIKKSYKVDQFYTMPVDTDSTVFDYDFMEIVDGTSDRIGYGIITLANGCKLGGCSSPDEIDPETEHEQFYFSTLYDIDGEIVNVRVLEYTSQHGYEITAKSWLKQFIGKKGGDLKVDREIDGISGATISVHSIVKEINKQQVLLELE